MDCEECGRPLAHGEIDVCWRCQKTTEEAEARQIKAEEDAIWGRY